MIDLQVNLNEVNLGTHVKRFKLHDEDFVTSQEFYNSITNLVYKWDVITYTVDPEMLFRFRVRRLLYHHQSKPGVLVCDQAEQVHNVHTKLYIGYFNNKPECAYLGSYNLVRPSLIDLLVYCGKRRALKLVNYFNAIWTQCSTTSHDSTTNLIA